MREMLSKVREVAKAVTTLDEERGVLPLRSAQFHPSSLKYTSLVDLGQ
jgi:hypothetical protein